MKRQLYTFEFVLLLSILPVSARTQTDQPWATPRPLPERIEFGPGRYILSGGLPILTDNSYSIPCVCDWNGDGNKDLLVGVYSEGNIYLFLNQGTDGNPDFAEGAMLAADGEPISVDYG